MEVGLEKDDNVDDEDVSSKAFFNSMVSNYIYDREKHLWCALTFNVSLEIPIS